MNGHILPVKSYVAVFVLLLVLLAVTVGVAHVNLGGFNVAVALAIAIAKALLVILFFMHVRYDRPVVWIYVSVGFFWLAILIALAMADFLTRS